VVVAKSSRQRRYDALLDSLNGATGDLTLEVGFGGNSFDFWINNAGSTALTTGTWSLNTVFDVMGSYDNTTFNLYINNSGNGTGTNAGRLFRQNFAIGGNYASAAFYHWKDDIYEILIYSKVLSSTERSNLRTYLTAKWGY